MASQLVQDALNEGFYSSTWVDSPGEEDHFLHTYANRTSELVQVGAQSGGEKILRNRK